jgi:heme o synthase
MIVENPPVAAAPRGSAAPVSAALAPLAPLGWRVRARAWYELTKPGITRMVLVTTAAGFYLATYGRVELLLLLHTLIGTTLAASGCSALNQVAERDADAHMPRTVRRPLPSGRLQPGEALVFATALAIGGLIYLLVFVNALTGALVALSISSYVFLYTPLKRLTWHATTIGAVPGALPILAGWTAAGGAIDVGGLGLFAILFFWQMPHFYALAWIYRDGYRAGGFRVLPSGDPTGRRLAGQVVLHGALLLPASLVPVALGMAGSIYLFGAIVLGVGYFALGAALAQRRDEARAWRLFFGSIIYLPALLLLMVVDKTPF